jgi:hypothetical protein
VSSSSTQPNEKKSGRPKSVIWRTYIQQGRKISQGHYNATCKFCNKKWHKGSPEECESHLANFCQKVLSDICDLFLNRLAMRTIEKIHKNHLELSVNFVIILQNSKPELMIMLKVQS